MRTTLDIEKPVLEGLKRIQKSEKQSLGKIASALLAEALNHRETSSSDNGSVSFQWATADMGAKVDIGNKDALYKAMEAE